MLSLKGSNKQKEKLSALELSNYANFVYKAHPYDLKVSICSIVAREHLQERVFLNDEVIGVTEQMNFVERDVRKTLAILYCCCLNPVDF